MTNLDLNDLQETINRMYNSAKLSMYEKFDLLLKIDQNRKLDEIIKQLKK